MIKFTDPQIIECSTKDEGRVVLLAVHVAYHDGGISFHRIIKEIVCPKEEGYFSGPSQTCYYIEGPYSMPYDRFEVLASHMGIQPEENPFNL